MNLCSSHATSGLVNMVFLYLIVWTLAIFYPRSWMTIHVNCAVRYILDFKMIPFENVFLDRP